MANRAHAKADVLQGTLDLMILQTVGTLGPLHGYAIAARLEQVSGGALHVNMGTLYPGLMRLEQRGLVRGKWAVTANNRGRASTSSRRRAGVNWLPSRPGGIVWFPSCTPSCTVRDSATHINGDIS
jgi:PadR family transcriptional regulator, regulatory protein PadR